MTKKRNPPAKPLSRRDVLKHASAAALTLGAAGAGLPVLSGCSPKPVTPTTKEPLRIMQWTHFVPRHDAWFDQFTQDWGASRDQEVIIDRVPLAEVATRSEAEFAAGEGHDLIEWVFPPSSAEPYVLDLRDINEEAKRRLGRQVAIAEKSSYNAKTNFYYGFCAGWAANPGDFRKSMWAGVGLPNGPSTWDELLTYGKELKAKGTPVGIGMSDELDSNVGLRSLLWSFGASEQDENNNVIINSPETLAAVEYMNALYRDAMPADVFSWTPATNNQLYNASQLSYIDNSISAYRTAQKSDMLKAISDDTFFVAALGGPKKKLASQHVMFVWIIPKHSKNPDAAKEFLLHLAEHYGDDVLNAEMYNLPAFPSTAANLSTAGGLLDKDPYGSNPVDKLAFLKNAEDWSINIGYPGTSNAATSEVFNKNIVPQMFANAAKGVMTPAQAIADAEAKIKAIYEKWRALGIVGGS